MISCTLTQYEATLYSFVHSKCNLAVKKLPFKMGGMLVLLKGQKAGLVFLRVCSLKAFTAGAFMVPFRILSQKKEKCARRYLTINQLILILSPFVSTESAGQAMFTKHNLGISKVGVDRGARPSCFLYPALPLPVHLSPNSLSYPSCSCSL